ncbi:resuscitation-promoting factor protein RpfC [Streptomyces sodiiphilus]|uniref:Resuscitation-promoting factor protein RpfC n=2 Tax=Streptomyces sodiiphilus TaxID=226217 RepID=A0ABN2P9E3_9ACTN
MLSGNGRHRRPRQAPAFVVAAGVTGAGLAMPLLGAGAAQAVTGETWDLVADCESDGVWSADTGNGYYGGLQLTLGMWEEFGGLDFAERPDLASRSQQITVAERILAAQGPQAFPTCAVTTGLWQESRKAAGGEGGKESREPGADEADGTGREPGERTGATGHEGGQGNGRERAGSGAGETPEGAEAGDSADRQRAGAGAGGARDGRTGGSTGEAPEEREGEAWAGEEAGAGERGQEAPGGKHRGLPDPQEDERAQEAGSGRHADRGRSREQAADAYEVRAGDSLSLIADRQAVPGGWPALYELNESVIGDNPDHILPGQELDLDVMAR